MKRCRCSNCKCKMDKNTKLLLKGELERRINQKEDELRRLKKQMEGLK